jgi:protein-S-isoprenylcysteine O-methyltransferase Ste14
MGHLEVFHIAVFACVILSWCVFALAFFFRRRGPAAPVARLGQSFLPGIILQGAGFASAWRFRRQLFTHIVEVPLAAEVLLAAVTVCLAAASVWFAVAAIRALGRHWSVEARTIEGHELVTTGPYAVVRHPIYAGLFGLLVATGLAISTWEGLAGAAVLYAAGSYVRIAGEEKLLGATFGDAYRQYAARVPAFLPFVK